MLRRLIIVRSGIAFVGCAVIGCCVFGCGLIFDTDKLGDGAAPSASDGGLNEGAGDTDGAGGDGAAGSDSNGASACPSGKGPSMVQIDSDYCIDSTEVTGAQYAIFVAAAAPDAGAPADLPQCAGNDSLGPVMEMGFPAPPPETPAFPVHGVDWCDAKAYCRWAGKDLCGAIGGKAGATLSPADAADPQKSRWENACSHAGTKRFAYSDDYSSGKCADGQNPVAPVHKTCEGGYDGIFDMVGNVAEWIDACEPPLDSQAPCALMGGSGGDVGSSDLASCTTDDFVQGTIPWGNAGIRCCAPALK
jgi:sulfatase modifying factor 1